MHGKLFQGRNKSLIVEEESYLGALQHYVHLNPVRSGMRTVAELDDYRCPAIGIYSIPENGIRLWISRVHWSMLEN